MENPVLLPESKMVVDRVTIGKAFIFYLIFFAISFLLSFNINNHLINIETHLLSDPTDPFNRSKLTRDMLIDCLELKEKIQEYKKSKMKK